MNIDRDQYYKMIATAYSFLVNFTKKNYDKLCFPRNKKKNCLSDTPKTIILAILRPKLRPYLGIDNFFSVIKLIVLQL